MARKKDRNCQIHETPAILFLVSPMPSPPPSQPVFKHLRAMDSKANESSPEPSRTIGSAFSTPLRRNDGSPNGTMYERLTECLHRLRDDLVIFRDPQVRSHLETLPVHSTISSSPPPCPISDTPTRDSLAQHLATILSLRTTLVEAEAALRDAREADLANRKRAARAEGKLAELVAQQDVNERSQTDTVDAAAARIRTVESEASNAVQKAKHEASRLSQRVTDLDTQVAQLKAAADASKKQAKRFETRALAAESELAAVKQSVELKERVTRLDLEAAKQREKRLLEEATMRTASSRQSAEAKDQLLGDERKRASLLEQQGIQLKSEVQWMSAKLARGEEELVKSEATISELKERIKQLENSDQEVKDLRARVTTLKQTEQENAVFVEKARALAREKDELRKLICSLVSSGDVKEGVNLLRRLANKDPSAVAQLRKFSNDDGGTDPANASLAKEAESLRNKCQELEKKLAERDAEGLHAEVSTGSMTVRVQQLLQKEVTAQQMETHQTVRSTEDVEMEEADSPRSLLEEYRKMLKEMDTVIGTREGEIERLKTELAAKGPSEENQHEEGEPDFDRKVIKVLHLSENPLQMAIMLHRAEHENMRSKKRVRGSDESLIDTISKKDADDMRQQMTEMREEYDELKRRAVLGDRTKQVALKRIEEVRSAVYNLFGWSMKVSGTMYRLSSIYAESPEEVLHFCVNEEGSMSLMDSPYAQKLSGELEQFVERMNSFPALLAHITIENFEKTTAFMP